uniref:cation diffusion facilitator family transporter n=1 Tax=Phocaeicola sp. TaxID=2773926 RepID=UPI003FEF684C
MENRNTSGRAERERRIYRVTIVGSVVNLALLLFKFAAGILGRSAAMLADAVHSLSDFVTDVIVLLFVRISNKPQDKDHDYGHGKYETLATALIGIILFFVGLGIFWNGARSIWAFVRGETLEAPGILALVAALLSIVTKEILYRYTVIVGRREQSQAVIANAWHHRSDALSSVGTAVGIGGAILLGDNWRVLDPVAAVVVSIFIVKVAWEMVVPCANELMEQSLPEQTEREIEEILLSFPGVTEPHNLRTRRVGNNCAIDVHVRMDGNLTLHQSHETTRAMEQRLRELLGEGTFINIHVEPAKG